MATELEGSKQAYLDSESALNESTQWALGLDEELNQLRESHTQLQETTEELTAWATTLNDQLAERTDWAESLEAELVISTEVCHKMEHDLDISEQWSKELHRERDNYKQLLNTQMELTNLLSEELASVTLNYHTVVDHKDQVVKMAAHEKQIVYASLSWKVSAPIRWVGSSVYLFGSGLQKGLIGVLRTSFHALPLSAYNKERFFRWSLKTFPVALKLVGQEERPSKLLLPLLEVKKVAKVDEFDCEQIPIFRLDPKPLVSIIIPVYGQIDYTIQCLRSIKKFGSTFSFEIIVVDDCSPDNTEVVMAQVDGVRFISNKVNGGFIRSCNRGASKAKGKYVHFLNNDTEVCEGWLDALVETFDNFSHVGLVGSKLVYPDGRLQEAGGIIWDDASGWNYGRLDDPDKPFYNYAREVDYISGASILLERELFLSLGGFDELYLPAYYEDADLAFAIRKMNKKVIYQPLSTVVHYEGITSGTDLTSGAKAYQVANAFKFKDKWVQELKEHLPNAQTPVIARERQIKGRILIIDPCTPTPDMDAGSIVAYYFMKIFIDMGYQVTFIPADNFYRMPKYTANLQKIGVECIYHPYYSTVESFLTEFGSGYAFAMLYRVNYADQYIDIVKKLCPQAKVIFNTVDLHYLRMERQAELEKSDEMMADAKRLKKVELSVMERADETIVLSEVEREILKPLLPNKHIITIPLILDVPGCNQPFAEREGIVFVGGFSHQPNADAVLYFVSDIWPLLRDRIDGLTFYIIGSNAPQEILDLHGDGIEVVGFVKELDEYFDKCKLSVVPLRYGAGIKGKVASSLTYGLPVVSTSIGIEGMGVKEGVDVLVANEADTFADAVERIYQDQVLWNSLSEAGLNYVKTHLSIEAGRKRLESLLS